MFVVDRDRGASRTDSHEQAEAFARQGSLACYRVVELRPFL
jgi:hypothetical protein